MAGLNRILSMSRITTDRTLFPKASCDVGDQIFILRCHFKVESAKIFDVRPHKSAYHAKGGQCQFGP